MNEHEGEDSTSSNQQEQMETSDAAKEKSKLRNTLGKVIQNGRNRFGKVSTEDTSNHVRKQVNSIPVRTHEVDGRLYYGYPYEYSGLTEYREFTIPVKLTDEATTAILGVEGSIVEIGGPSKEGYDLLGNKTILTSAPIITDYHFFSGEGIEQVDGTAMPYQADTIGMFLMKNMGETNLAEFWRTEREHLFYRMKQQERWNAIAKGEIEKLIADPTGQPRFNLHAGILKEMERTLTPAGVVLIEHIGDRGIEYARRLGFEVLDQIKFGNSYDCVLRKPTEELKSEALPD